jgi:hypothetical protein
VVAKTLGITNVQMFRQVQHFLELGLLEVTKLETRAGKAIKHYRSVAPGFFIPHTLLPSETLEVEYLTEDDFWRRCLARGIAAITQDAMSSVGSYIFRNDQDEIRKVTGPSGGLHRLPEQGSPQPHMPPIWSDWSVVILEPEDARAFYRDMVELFRRYKACHHLKKGRAYLMRTAMAPLCEADAAAMATK